MLAAASLWAVLLWHPIAQAQAGPAQAEPAAPPSTAAETLLFETDHLAGLAVPAQLEYKFSWNGEHPFEDRILLKVGRPGARDVEPDYLSGPHHVGFPPSSDAHGNPLLLYFLESDLREMQQQSHGRADHFRRQIRLAMAAPDVKVEALRTTAAGRAVTAQRLVLAPFRDDPLVAKHYPAYAQKTYEFVLSPEVPGQVVLLATHMPPSNGAGQDVRVEWQGVAPLAAAPPEGRPATQGSMTDERH